jgi:hypothetical protein
MSSSNPSGRGSQIPAPPPRSSSTDEAFIKAMLAAETQAEETRRLQAAKDEEALTMKLLQEEREAAQAALDAKTYECPSCWSDWPLADMFSMDQCSHKFCIGCMGDYFTSKITQGEARDIKCPNSRCTCMATYDDVQQVFKKDLKMAQKYEEFLLKNALDADPNCRYCPRPGCGYALFGNKHNPMIVCGREQCKFTFCFNCREEWHADSTCEQYQAWKAENAAAEDKFEQWRAKNTKACPKCKSPIEKNGGCNHMTCRLGSCKHQFCWLCMSDYVSGHFSNNTTGCKQFT